MLLLFRSVLRVCCGSRCGCRVQQGCPIGNPVYIRLYRLSLFIRWVRVRALTAYHKCTPCKRSSKFYYVSELLNPVVDVYQGRSVLRLGTLHKSRHVYPAVIWLDLQLEVRPIRSSYCAGFIPALWISVKHIFSWKENTSTNWPCFNKALLSSFFELCNLCKCLCHS